MPLFEITVTRSGNFSGVRLEKGMSTEVVVNTNSLPLGFQGGAAVREAFMRKYGVDLRKANALSQSILTVRKIS